MQIEMRKLYFLCILYNYFLLFSKLVEEMNLCGR